MKKTICKRGILSIFILVMSVLFLLAPDLFAQDEGKTRLAVLDFNATGQELEPSDLNKIVTEWLTTFLVSTGTFEVVERQELEKVLQEQSLGQTGIIDSDSAAQVGRILGVNILITGTIISFEDTLEVTARLIDTTNGTIVDVATVTTEAKEELRVKVKELAEIIRRKLSVEQVAEDVKLFETFDENAFNMERWVFVFDEKFKQSDKNQTILTQQDSVLKITGKYQKDDKHRSAWLAPNSEIQYCSIEAKIRVREVVGEISACVDMNWNDWESWTGICLYFEKEYTDLTVGIEDLEWSESTFDFDIRLNQWYVLRLDCKDGEFYYYWDNQLIKQITPNTPVRPSEELYVSVDLSLEATRAMTVEIDDISLR